MRFFQKIYLLVAAGVVAEAAGAQTLNPLPHTHRFIVVSHRGDHEHAPENTLAAFSNAIRAGVDFIEIDLRTTADSQLVIMHDATVNRMTNGMGFVKDLTLDSLRHLKVTDRAHPEWGSFEIPLFSQVLELCRKGGMNIYLDFKNARAAQAYREIVKYGMEKRVIVYINEPHQFTDWRAAAPAMPLMVSLPRTVQDTASLRGFLTKVSVEVLDGGYEEYTPAMVALAESMGSKVLPDIQGPNENRALWESAIAKGFIGLQTDHPEEMIAYLKSRNIR